MTAFCFLIYLVFTLIILYRSLPAIVWEIGSFIYVLTALFYGGMSWISFILIGLVILAISLIVRVQSVRLAISHFLYRRAVNTIPKLSF